MTAVPYTTLAAVKGQLGIGSTDTSRDTDLTTLLTVVSFEIDKITGTQFGTSGNAPTARVFSTTDGQSVWVDRFTSTTGLVVATGIRGNYNTTIAAGNYVLWPPNAPSRNLAYERIDVPYYFFQLAPGDVTVQVTATWGWSNVPAEIEWAARMMAARLFKRHESLEGVLGPSEWGAVRVGRNDPDIDALLAPYIGVGIA